tara:strand:+ start:2664 stop:2780 length:117 start_codon:yes stop_codon:yes gene_type:complete
MTTSKFKDFLVALKKTDIPSMLIEISHAKDFLMEMNRR